MKIRRNYTIELETDKILRDIAEQTKLKMSTIVDLAIKLYEKETKK